MESVDVLRPLKQRFISSEGLMDTFPEELIGTILAHVDSAWNLAMASATCHKWHEAAMHHLHKLTFIASDFTKQRAHTISGMKELIITPLVMKKSCLLELSITAVSSYAFQAAPVIAWLLHTRKTLKSLVFMNRTVPSVNILENLGGNLEKLGWQFACIPTVDPATPSFQSLSSLELTTPVELTGGNLQALLLVCPKLEQLKLIRAHILPDVGAPWQRTLELVSSSLKYLNIDGGLSEVDNLVLHINSLKGLTLTGLTLKLLKLVHGKGSNALQNLFICGTDIEQLDFDGAANSLLELGFGWSRNDITAEWGKYYEVVSGASNLRKLEICGVSNTRSSSIDLHKVSSSFPSLRWLAIDYENAFEAFTSSTQSPFLEKVVVLDLGCNKAHEAFAQWIAQFLERCASLRRLTITVEDIIGDNRALGRFTSLMVQILRPYPLVDVTFSYAD